MHSHTRVNARLVTGGRVALVAFLAMACFTTIARAQGDATLQDFDVAQLGQDLWAVPPTAAATVPTAAATPAATAPTELTEVQVTGTRIIRQGYEAPTPVTAIGLQDLQDAAKPNIGDALNQLPVFQGSLTSTNQVISDTESIQTELNLRNLGASRTLVLFDGRRLPAANTEDVPDVDLIPDALIQRVDVVTGGASAVYGSDAVAGVVNYVLDTNFTGLKGLVEGGISSYGDGPSDKIQLTGGTSFFDGRLHLIASGDQEYQGPIQGYARSWNVNGQSSMQNPAYKPGSQVPQFIAEPCCVSTTYPPGGMILSGPLQGTTFGAAGSVGQYDYGYGLTKAGNDDYGGSWQDSSMHGAASIMPTLTNRHFFVRAGFDLSPNTEAYAEYLGGWNHTVDDCCYDYYQTGIGTLYTSNPFIPQSVLNAAASAPGGPVTSFTVGDSLRFPTNQFTDGGLGVNDFRYTDVYAVGLKGKFQALNSSWNWNAYAQQGINIEDFNISEAIKSNLSNAIQAVRVGSYGPNNAYGLTGYTAANYPNPLGIPNGTITCLSNLLPRGNPNATSNCAPYNIFGTGVVSQAAINYTQGYSHLRQDETQSIVGADVTGEPFSTWAGPVSIALDAEYRNESAAGFSDPISRESGWFSTNFFPFLGSLHVVEGALETVVPLVRNAPGVQELDVNGGARATDYSTSGYVTTYKLGVEYTPVTDLRFRGTYSEDIRAPNLSNLYGFSEGHGTNVDPFFGNISAPSYTITAGNPALQPEKAHQYEIGLVFQPTELPGFNLSVDYWHIRLTGAISTVPSTYELQQCYNTRIAGTYTGTSPYCSLIQRNADGSLYSVEVIPFNVASFLMSGVDYQATYRKQLADIVTSWKGAFEFNVNATNTQHVITDTGIPGPAEITDATGTGGGGFTNSNSPRWAVFATLAYELDQWRFVWQERYDSAVLAGDTYIVCSTNCPSVVPAGFNTVGWYPRIPAYYLANVTLEYKFMQQDQREAEAFINVDNLFNKIPHWADTVPGQLFNVETNPTLYDEIGTYVHAGIRFRL